MKVKKISPFFLCYFSDDTNRKKDDGIEVNRGLTFSAISGSLSAVNRVSILVMAVNSLSTSV